MKNLKSVLTIATLSLLTTFANASPSWDEVQATPITISGKKVAANQIIEFYPLLQLVDKHNESIFDDNKTVTDNPFVNSNAYRLINIGTVGTALVVDCVVYLNLADVNVMMKSAFIEGTSYDDIFNGKYCNGNAKGKDESRTDIAFNDLSSKEAEAHRFSDKRWNKFCEGQNYHTVSVWRRELCMDISPVFKFVGKKPAVEGGMVISNNNKRTNAGHLLKAFREVYNIEQ